MPPAKWDDSEEESSSGSEEESSPPVVAVGRKKFDDEEDSDEVIESWDAAEDSEEERKKAAKAAALKAKADAEALANKKTKKERIEEQREARRKKALEDETSDEDDEDDADKRARLRKSEQDSDLKHAQDLFDSTGLGPNKTRSGNKTTIIDDPSNPGQTIDLAAIPLFKPSTKTQFDNLSAVLVPLLASASSRPHYALWVQDFVKKITADLPSTEIKKAASALTAQSNEKMKEEKMMDKTGKKTKAAKSKATLAASRDIGRGMADTTAYGDDGLADDDFM